jgi:ribosomal protein S18 acetylase RimI-like enzyme
MTHEHDAPSIRVLPRLEEDDIGQLADVLVDCVESGASVSFMQPMTRAKAMAFWTRAAADVAAGKRAVLAASDATGIIGTVQVIFDLPENQPHRAEIAKMLVLQRARRRGIGAALMRAAEDCARQAGRTVLVLDTSNDEAARLYERLGWQFVGTVPDYALWPQGGLCATTFYYRRLA